MEDKLVKQQPAFEPDYDIKAVDDGQVPDSLKEMIEKLSAKNETVMERKLHEGQ
jgi:hypothetical protein